MLVLIVGILLVLWVIGLATKVAGKMIHLVLVVALIVLAVALLGGHKLF